VARVRSRTPTGTTPETVVDGLKLVNSTHTPETWKKVQIFYFQHAFRFEPTPGNALEGRLILDDEQRDLLHRLEAAEPEDWFLDDEGNRLPSEELFERTPWSCQGPSGPIKLLCRFIDYNDGRARFDVPETYVEGGLLGLIGYWL
jgi:hypothetical protein